MLVIWLVVAVLFVAGASASTSVVENEAQYASAPTVVKRIGRVCFTLYAHAAGLFTIAQYEAHAKLWRVDAVSKPEIVAADAEMCTMVLKPGLYRVIRLASPQSPPSVSTQEPAVEIPPNLKAGPVHYITLPTTTAPPTAVASVPSETSSVSLASDTEAAVCPCPCMTGAPACTTVNKCWGIYCGAHGGTCDAGTGQCVCPADFTGPSCQTPSCSWHGFYSPLSEQCVCRAGWGGYACQTCAAPLQSGHQYLCIPHVSPSNNYAVTYLLMALTLGDARDFLSGVKRADAQIPYRAIYQNTVGFDGQRYDCECLPEGESMRRRQAVGRIDSGALDAYNATVVQCIENSNATAQQTADMISLWTTCVTMQEQGLLTNGWWIASIILGIVALVEMVVIILGCVVWSSQAQQWSMSKKY